MHGDPSVNDLEGFVLSHPSLKTPLDTLVDRCERSGRLPRSITLAVDRPTAAVLRQVFSARAVSAAGEGRVRLDLAGFLRTTGRAEAEFVSLLRAALGRAARDPAALRRLRRSELETRLSELLQTSRAAPSKAFIEARLRELREPSSELLDLALASGNERAVELVRAVTLCLDGIREVRAPVRIQNFAARVLGSSKALRPGSDLARWVGTALVDHDPLTRRALDEQGVPPHRTTEVARALEVNGVYQDEVAASVLCFGPLVYKKQGERFDHVARHAALGETSRVTAHQLRDAVVEEPAARRATVFENLAPFLDYVDACIDARRSDEIVLCSSGQASWAVVALLSGLAKFALTVRHSGDLDRSGVLILRSLKRRSGARIMPLFMDAKTHALFEARGQALASEERRRLERLLADDDPALPCHDLLVAILRSGLWVEQEQFSEECLSEALR